MKLPNVRPSSIPCWAVAGWQVVNPEAWLTDVLGRIPDHSAQRLDELLPMNWKQTKQKTTKLLPPLENRILLAQAMQV